MRFVIANECARRNKMTAITIIWRKTDCSLIFCNITNLLIDRYLKANEQFSINHLYRAFIWITLKDTFCLCFTNKSYTIFMGNKIDWCSENHRQIPVFRCFICSAVSIPHPLKAGKRFKTNAVHGQQRRWEHTHKHNRSYAGMVIPGVFCPVYNTSKCRMCCS